MNAKLNTALIIISLLLTLGLNAQWIKGSGNIVKQTRDTESFKSINNSSSADVIIKHGNKISVVVETDDNLVKHIITKVKDDILYIKIDKSFRNIETLKIRITMPNLDFVKISGSGDISFPETFKTNELSVSISGSGDFTGKLDVNKLEYKVVGSGDAVFSGVNGELKITVSGSGDIEARDLRLTNCDIKINGSGDIEIYGNAENLNLRQSGSGDINAYNLKAVNVMVKASGSGDVQLYAIEKLNAVASGSGDVYYKGSPISINIDSNGSGEIYKR